MSNHSEDGGTPASAPDDDPFALDDRVQATDARPVTQPFPARSSQDELS